MNTIDLKIIEMYNENVYKGDVAKKFGVTIQYVSELVEKYQAQLRIKKTDI